MRCVSCNQAERRLVRRAKMVERNGKVAIIHDVPMEECPSCGSRWLTAENAVHLDAIARRLIDSGAEVATGHWDALLHAA